MEQITTQQYPLNVIYIRCPSSLRALLNLQYGREYLLKIPYLVSTQFHELIFPPESKNLASDTRVLE